MTSLPHRFELDLVDMAFRGEAVGRFDGRVVFAAYGIPGERVEVELYKHRSRFARGKVVAVHDPSPFRVSAPCPYFGECGGCQWQHIDYPKQLEFKQKVLADQLRRIGRFEDPPVRPPVGMVDPWRYRNHARFSVDYDGRLGFMRPESHDFLGIDHCLIMQEPINQVLRLLQGRVPKLHQVVVRCSLRTGQVLVEPRHPAIPWDEAWRDDYLEEELLGRRFRVSPPSFFQVNTRPERRDVSWLIKPGWGYPAVGDYSIADILGLLVIKYVDPTGVETVVDAYSGVGTFGVILADKVRRVIGIEESRSAVRDSRHNSRGVPNFEMIEAKTEAVLPTLDMHVDAVILDPPRVGCAPEVMTALLKLAPPKVIYVSCDPATLARDLRILVDGGYRLVEIQPLDMFPQTYHIESVSLLVR